MLESNGCKVCTKKEGDKEGRGGDEGEGSVGGKEESVREGGEERGGSK